MGRVTEKGRLNATAGLGDFINSERSRLFDGATPERRQQFRQAERRHESIMPGIRCAPTPARAST